jgi:hypothetical protein
MAKIAGTCSIHVDGISYDLRGDLTVSLGGEEGETIVGLDGVHGIMVKPRASFVEATFTDSAGLDIEVLESLDDVTVVVSLVNGKTGILRNATQIKAIELGVDDGKMTVRFEGPKGEWMAAA